MKTKTIITNKTK